MQTVFVHLWTRILELAVLRLMYKRTSRREAKDIRHNQYLREFQRNQEEGEECLSMERH